MPALLKHGWSVPGGKFMVQSSLPFSLQAFLPRFLASPHSALCWCEVPYLDWVGTTDMDTMEPFFEAYPLPALLSFPSHDLY